MSTSGPCTVIHAYSSRNSGDGLLVNLTLQLLAEAGVRAEDVHLVASDPESFSYLEDEGVTVEPLVGGSSSALLRAAHGVKNIVSWKPRSNIDPRLIVAVGGGYLRFGDPIEALKTTLVHVPQLRWAGSRGLEDIPVVYLPQSVGPLGRVFSAAVQRHLREARVIFVRDDVSMGELCVSNVARAPDLATLALADRPVVSTPGPARGPLLLIARSLGRVANRTLVRQLLRLQNDLPNVVLGLQSRGRGNDDARFYRSNLGLTIDPPLVKHILTSSSPGTTVSVRLHGALESILNGWPAIHLSYERKGQGVYADLGLDRFVHSARSFDVELVEEQVAELRENPEEYWAAIDRARPGLLAERTKLIELLRDAWASSK